MSATSKFYSIITTSLYFLLITVLLTSCSSEKLSDREAPDFSLASYRTFSFGDLPDTSPEDLRFRSVQFENRVKSELRFVLPQKGLETSSDPDLLVYFFTLPEQDEDFQSAALPYTQSMARTISEIPENHNFVIDIVDKAQGVLVWRTSGNVEIENEERRNRMLPDLIKEMMKDLPS